MDAGGRRHRALVKLFTSGVMESNAVGARVKGQAAARALLHPRIRGGEAPDMVKMRCGDSDEHVEGVRDGRQREMPGLAQHVPVDLDGERSLRHQHEVREVR